LQGALPFDQVMLGGNGAFGVLGLIVLLLPVKAFYGSFAMLLPLYILQGLGRGIFESTNKAVIADYCPGAKAEVCQLAACDLRLAACYLLVATCSLLLAAGYLPRRVRCFSNTQLVIFRRASRRL